MIETDLLVIGAGLAGLTLAQELSRAGQKGGAA
jgi:2-polyprenyl-6-methoxyphenol hydroxylase-like FAD-dependent oxidoreductase